MSAGLALQIPLAEAELILQRVPVDLPKVLDEDEARKLVEALRAQGAACEVAASAVEGRSCPHHPTLVAEYACENCSADICLACARRDADHARCPSCSRRRRRSRRFYAVRVSVLLLILIGVLLYAWLDVRSRRSRITWQRPLQVAIVLVRAGAVPAETTDQLRLRLPALQARLAQAFARYRPGGDPVYFQMAGPVDFGRPPSPRGDGLLDAVRDTWRLRAYTREVDRLAKLDAAGTDARIYLAVRPPEDERRRFVEGFGEHGGRIGIVEVELDDTMVDYALLVTVHELLHTIGATDKYDETGRARVPDGLAEPDQVPLYPQRQMEVMARGRPVSAGTEELPESIDELGIGPATAREIGLLPPQ